VKAAGVNELEKGAVARVRTALVWIAFTEFVLLLLPLLFASLTRPFGLWDYLTAPNIYLPDQSFGLRSVASNYIHNVFWPAPTVRPTTALLLNLEYCFFGGEFWLWYIVRWAGKLGGLALSDGILRNFGIHPYARLGAAALWLFHPVWSDQMLISVDGWVALCAVLVLRVLVQFNGREQVFDVVGLTARRYAMVFGLWFALLGTKEVGFVLSACFFLMVVLSWAQQARVLPWRSILRLAPFASVLVLWAWKISVALRDFPSNNVRSAGGPRIHLSTLAGHVHFLAAGTPFGAGAWVLAATAVWLLWRWRRPTVERPLLVFLALCIVGCLCFVSITETPAARYVTPAVAAGVLLSGFVFHDISRYSVWVPAAVALVFPIVAAGDLYTQSLAYQQHFYETADVLNVVEQAAAAGYTPALTGDNEDIPLENQGTIRLYFEKYGPQFYARPRAKVVLDLSKGPPITERQVVLISHRPVYDASEGVRERLTGFHTEQVYQVERGGYGLLEAASFRLGALDRALGVRPFPAYDQGAPVATTESYFYLSLLTRNERPRLSTSELAASPAVEAEWANFSRRVITKRVLNGEGPSEFGASAGEVVKLTIPLPERLSAAQLSYEGAIKANGGNFIFGVTDGAGKDLWNTVLPADGKWLPIPQAPRLRFDPSVRYYLFVYGTHTRAGEISLKQFKMDRPQNIVVLPGLRRFGGTVR
jgi:hypothetical protein